MEKAREPKKQHLFQNSNVNVLSTTSKNIYKYIYNACAISKAALKRGRKICFFVACLRDVS